MSSRIDWVARTKEYADKSVAKIGSLMEYFYIQTKLDEFKTAVDELESIKMLFNSITITQSTAPYFLRFEKEISEQNVEALLKFDYESLIQEDSFEKDTDKTIRKIIASIKNMWNRGVRKQQFRIKTDIIELLKLSLLFNDALSKC